MYPSIYTINLKEQEQKQKNVFMNNRLLKVYIKAVYKNL